MGLLDRQNVVRFLRDDLFGEALLATHHIDGHHRSVQLQSVEQFRNGIDLLDFSSALRCANTSPLPSAQAETIGTIALVPGSSVPHNALPSIATTSPTVSLAMEPTHATKTFSNCSGSSTANTRLNVS